MHPVLKTKMRGRINSPGGYFRQYNNQTNNRGAEECLEKTPPKDKPPSRGWRTKSDECKTISYDEFRKQLESGSQTPKSIEMKQIQLFPPKTDSKAHLTSMTQMTERLVDFSSEAIDIETGIPQAQADDIDQDEQDFSSESIALSGDDRVHAIRAVLLVFCAQVIICCISAGLLLSSGSGLVPGTPVKVFALCGLIVTGYAAYQSCCVLNSCKWLSMINFGVFSGCLSVNLASLGMILPSGSMNHWMAQFCSAVVGLTIYAWMTRYEQWNTKEETIFNVVPIIFASAIMLFVFGNSFISIVASGALSFGICRLLQDCSKDSFSCLERLDLICGEVIGLYSACFGRLSFILTHKFQKNFVHKSAVI